MDITHRIKKDNIYIYINFNDDTEFSKEFLNLESNNNFMKKLKEYINKYFDKDSKALLMINGILIGTLSLAMFFPINLETKNEENQSEYSEYIVNNINDNNTKSISKIETNLNNELMQVSYVKKTEEKESNEEKEEIKNIEVEDVIEVQETPVNNDTKIKLSTNGVVSEINLEEYVVGVVAAEMPVSFNSEALKAQAVVSRTFAMNKYSQGITLINSTSHQLYKNKEEQKELWGDSFEIYYNKIKNAVYDTKGIVMKYDGEYIEALYHAISNGTTESPKYIWGSNLEYLQSVSSSWDTYLSDYEDTIFISYLNLNTILGTDLDESKDISINSYTVSNRVDSITISGKTFSGVTLRSKLGLKSTDFTITKLTDGVNITTKGYGHGVGMSQYGANEAATEGYLYDEILKHYYTNISIVKM